MNSNFYGLFFRMARSLVRKIYPKYRIEIPQNFDGPVVYISHHQNLFGPFITLLWFPKALHAWILHVFLDQRACYHQYVDYTFTKRFGWNRTLAKICAFLISIFIAKLLNSGKGIPVYRGSRKILQTFHLSMNVLANGESIVIFPDIDYSDSSANVKEMYDGFLYLEKYYYKKTGKHVCFIPLYVSKKRRLLIAEKEIYFRDDEDFNAERKIVLQKIRSNLNELAEKCGDISL
jgi:1-acyl-sn-glycerol-3-phosphate acyltransferase